MSNAFVAPFPDPRKCPGMARTGPLGRTAGLLALRDRWARYKTRKPGWYRCAGKECRKDFTVTTGTVIERSHIPLNKWLMAFYAMNDSKKGTSVPISYIAPLASITSRLGSCATVSAKRHGVSVWKLPSSERNGTRT
jgi:hypothetical protein